MLGMGKGNPCFGHSTDNRVFIERILQATNLQFAKDSRPTAFIFQCAVGDSIRIECADCQTRIKNADGKGKVNLALTSSLEKRVVQVEQFGKWLPVISDNGKLGLIFERNGNGERMLSVNALTVTRKTRSALAEIPGKPLGLLEVNNLLLDGYEKAMEGKSPSFFFKLRSDDQVKLDLVGIDRSMTDGVGCYFFRVGEEFAKKPIAIGSSIPVSGGTNNHDVYGFAIAHNKDVKQGQLYHLSITRTPASTPNTSSARGK
jgi:hypothetical protein